MVTGCIIQIDNRWRWQLCCFLLVGCAFALPITEGKIICGQRLHETFIYRLASSGTNVTRVRAHNEFGSSPITYHLENGQETFKLVENSGLLSTAAIIDRSAGQFYNLSVRVQSGIENQVCKIPVRVTDKNRHRTVFTKPNVNRRDVLYNLKPGTRIIKLNTTDGSPEPYNQESYFFLREVKEDHDRMTSTFPSMSKEEIDQWMHSELDHDSKVSRSLADDYLAINISTGEVYLRRQLDVNVGRLVATVMALNAASPPLASTASLEVLVKAIGAPLNVTVTVIAETAATVCWSPSPIGIAMNFIVMFQTLKNQTVGDQSSIGVKRSDSPPCHNLTQLQPDTDYELWVYGFNKQVTGLNSSKVLFNTGFSLCDGNPCHKAATCSEEDGNVTCTCPLANIGVDDAHRCPCLNGGKYAGLAKNIMCECSSEYRGSNCHFTNFCPAYRIENSKGTFNFNKTDSDTWAYSPCQYGPPGVRASRRCAIKNHDMNSIWENFNDSACFDLKQFENLFQAALNNYTSANKSFTIVSSLMNGNWTDVQASNRVVRMVENFVSNSGFKEPMNITTENVRVEVRMVPIDANWSGGDRNWPNVTFTGLASKRLFLNDTFQQRVQPSHDSSLTDGQPTVTISGGAFDSFATEQNTTNIQINFVAYRTAALFRGGDSEGVMAIDSFVDRPVLTVSLANHNITNLNNVVNYKVKKPKCGKWYCVYWDEEMSRWSDEGMAVEDQTDHTVTCSANHMTSFSILFDPTPDESTDDDQKAMSYISYVGSGLSIVGLILTIITFALFRCLNRHSSGKILLNLCSSMILLNVSFLLGAFQSGSRTVSGQTIEKSSFTCNEEVNVTATPSPAQGDRVCMAVAVFTHYFLLTTLSWMTVEAINLYQLLIFVFGSLGSHFLLKRCIVAWGAPAVIVGVTVAVDRAYYNSTNHSCMLSAFDSYVYYFTLFGPCCILLLINVIVFVMVTRVLCQPRRISGRIPTKVAPTGKERSEDGVTWSQVRGAFTVMTLLGVTWVFGAFAVSGNRSVREVFQYVFCVLNSLQGFLVFLFRCLLYPEARSAWMMLFRTGTLKKERGPTKVTTNTTNHTQQPTKVALHATSSDASCGTNGGYHLSTSKTDLTCTDLQGANRRLKQPPDFTCGYKKADGPKGEDVIYSNWSYCTERQRMVNNNTRVDYPLIDLS